MLGLYASVMGKVAEASSRDTAENKLTVEESNVNKNMAMEVTSASKMLGLCTIVMEEVA